MKQPKRLSSLHIVSAKPMFLCKNPSFPFPIYTSIFSSLPLLLPGQGCLDASLSCASSCAIRIYKIQMMRISPKQHWHWRSELPPWMNAFTSIERVWPAIPRARRTKHRSAWLMLIWPSSGDWLQKESGRSVKRAGSANFWQLCASLLKPYLLENPTKDCITVWLPRKLHRWASLNMTRAIIIIIRTVSW